MAREKASINVKILNKDGSIYNGKCQVLFVPYKKEEIAILPLHTPIIALLSNGKIRIKDDSGTRTVTEITSGIIYVGEDEVSVLVDV
jgi:F-type H+-transporting ATPase subunit epsilon